VSDFPLPASDWLAAWLSDGMTCRAALERFDGMPAAKLDGLTGLWRGRSLPTGHPLDGLLEALDWYGKEILSDRRVHPLLFRRRSGRRLALDPAWMPVEVALRWPALARSPVSRAVFRAVSPGLQAQGPAARIETRAFRGRSGAAIVYDRQPIVDHLRRIDTDRLLGLMERRGMSRPYFFLLTRETGG
jgi:hypothetical protein